MKGIYDLSLTTAPENEPLTAQEVMAHLRLEDDDENDWIETAIVAIREIVERDILNRALITQTWDMAIEDWPDDDELEIPLPPLVSITSITYYDTDDVSAVFASSSYDVRTKREPGYVKLKYGETWPTVALRPSEGIVVVFVAGYGAEAANVPAQIRKAMLMMIAHLYENRETIVTGTTATELPFSAEFLLQPLRIIPI